MNLKLRMQTLNRRNAKLVIVSDFATVTLLANILPEQQCLKCCSKLI